MIFCVRAKEIINTQATWKTSINFRIVNKISSCWLLEWSVLPRKKKKTRKRRVHPSTHEQSFCAFFDSVFMDPVKSIPIASNICLLVKVAIFMKQAGAGKGLKIMSLHTVGWGSVMINRQAAV